MSHGAPTPRLETIIAKEIYASEHRIRNWHRVASWLAAARDWELNEYETAVAGLMRRQGRVTAFDDPALHDYPVGSDLCMAEFFLPLAYEAGWRLANEAPTLWAAFEFVAARRGRTAGNIGMQWVMASLRTMLFEGTALDRPGFQYDLESWVKAVESSEYESSLQ